MTATADLDSGAPLSEILAADLPARLAALEALGASIAAGDLDEERDQHSGHKLGEASVRVHRICARLTGKRYEWLAVEEADGLWATTAFHPRTFASHVAHTHGISYNNANRAVRLARQLRDHIPQFGAALRAGTIGEDQVAALASTVLTSPARIAALSEIVDRGEDSAVADGTEPADGPDADTTEPGGNADGPDRSAEDTDSTGADTPGQEQEGPGPVTVAEYLLGQARQLRPDQVRRLGKHFARVADPEADERGYRQAKAREYVELVRTLDGWHLSGFLTEENGRLVRAAMDAVMTPPAPDDERTGEQRRAQALADVAHLVLDQGPAPTRACGPTWAC